MASTTSLRRKLPLLISALLGVAVTGVCWSAYRQVEETLLESAATRLGGMSRQLAAMLQENAREQRGLARGLAAQPALVAFVAEPSARSRAPALALLETPMAGGPRAASYAIWSRAGERLAMSGSLVPVGDGAPPPAAAGTLRSGIGPLVRAGDGVMFEVATPVLGAAGDTIGTLVAYRRASSRRAADQLRGLIGPASGLLVGNEPGDTWTDLRAVVPGPPRTFPLGRLAGYRDEQGARQLGVAMPVASTPWRVMVQSPRRIVLAPARDFLLRVVGIGVVMIALGALAAWVISRQVTAPLAEVSRAARDLAAGDYSRRADVARGDEIGSLAASFNAMAAQVDAASRDLRGQAVALQLSNAQLSRSEEQYRGLLEAAHEGICVVDAAGRITYANLRLAAMLGHGLDALQGMSFFELVEPGSVFEARSRFARRLRGIAETRELALLHRDGTLLWTNESASSLFDGDGAFTGALFLLTDVTAQRTAREHVARSERQFRAMIENASDMICVLDVNGRQRYVSPSHERFVGFVPAEIEGMVAFDAIHPDDLPAVLAAFGEILGRPGGRVAVGFRYRHKDGSWRDFAAVATNLLADPAVEGIVVNSQDVSEQRALEAQLRQAQKMDAVGRLAGGVAHDFNNMLTAIRSYAELVLLDVDQGGSVARGDVEEITAAADRATALTRQLLAFSRQQMLQPRVLDLNATVTGLQGMLARLIGSDVTVTLQLEPGLGAVRADPGQLEQVLLNLGVNARDAMPGGGTLTFATANVTLVAGPGADGDAMPAGHYVRLTVRDTGQGMSAATQARIFEPFFTTKEVGRGTGLGLSTVYGIVRQSGGYIWVSSTPGSGAMFTVYLPRVDDAPTHDRAAVGTVSCAGAETLLLVDDDPAVRGVARRILTRAGYTVREAATGVDAMRLVADPAVTFDLLVTDMIMPELGGRELADRVRAERPGVRVLFMSGFTEEAAMRQSWLPDGAHFLAKPFTPETLACRVREVLDDPACMVPAPRDAPDGRHRAGA